MIGAGVLSAALVVGCVWAVVARLAGQRVPLVAVVLAALLLALGAVLAAALAAYALVRREWWWALGLLVLWPALIPPYLARLRGSAEPEV